MSTTTQRTRASAFGLNNESEREASGAFPIRESLEEQLLESDAVIAELSPDLVSLIPEPPVESRRPRAATPSERAELVFEDLSLSLENPYLASSLIPPPQRPFPLARTLVIAGGMLAAAAIGAVIQLSVLRAPHESTVRSQAAAGITAPPPVAVASPRDVLAPPAAVAPVAVVPTAVLPAPEIVAPAAAVVAATPAVIAAKPVLAKPIAAIPAAPAMRTVVVLPAPPEPMAVIAPAVDLPEYPTREQVTAGFESVRTALAQCAAGQQGTAMIKATISANGRISYALVGGDFDGSAAGSCMAKAVRDAQFPAFTQPRLKVSYPFAL